MNRFANAQNVNEIIEQLAAGAVGADRADAKQIATEAKERLIELGVKNFG